MGGNLSEIEVNGRSCINFPSKVFHGHITKMSKLQLYYLNFAITQHIPALIEYMTKYLARDLFVRY